jgi:tape measure domain-containing protein
LASSSSKVLTATVKLDTSQAERKLENFTRKFNQLNKAVNNSANSSNRMNTVMTSNFNKTGKAVDSLTKKVGKLAKAYLGVMGARAMITTSDTITRAENMLNNLPAGYQKSTQDSMDKMFVSSQSARTGYAEMMKNVSKSMTLAGEAFQGNIDNAIRFQEIMAKAYSVGGASKAEQSSSMYQLIQALGSGKLQGDELRSITEGAPVAAKKIEEFAQEVYKTTDSLKEMGSEGLLTADLVVAAIMNAGQSIDDAFANTEMTFEQAFTNIKNTAIMSFKPVLQRLNDVLNSNAGKAIINGIGYSLQIVAGVLQKVFDLIEGVYNFINDNWTVIRDIIMTLGVLLGVYLLIKVIALISTFKAFILKAVFGLFTLIGEFIALGNACGYATAMSMMFGVNLNMWAWIAIGLLALLVIAIIWVSDSFVDACGNIAGAVWVVISFIITLLKSLWNYIKAVGTNIGIAMSNPWEAAKAAFWGFVADCLEGIKDLEPALNAIAKLFGLEGFTLSGAIDYARSKEQENLNKLNYVDTSAAFTDTWKDWSVKGAFDEGYQWGSEKGQGLVDKIDELKNKLGLDNNLNDLFDKYPTTGGSYDPGKALKGIGDDTGKIADSMDLTTEDLEYLRKVADMEWKKEFTTATIHVDMTNNNTLNGESDLDGIVTKLADKLYEELDSVANGVYS